MRASDGALLPLDTLKNQQILLFAGIADSDSFVSTAKALGVRILHRRDFGDHHAYTSQEVAALARIRCEAAITTEKDLVKVALHWPRQAPPLYALRVGMELDDPSRFEAALRKTLQEMHKPATEGMPTTAAAPPPAPRVSPPEATEVKNELTEVETEEAKPAEIKEPDPLLPPSEPVSAAEMKRARVPLPSRHDNPRPNGHRPRPTRRNGNPDPPHDS